MAKNRLSIDRYQGAGEVGSRNEGRGNLSRLFLQPDLPVDPQGIEGASYAGGVSVRGFA